MTERPCFVECDVVSAWYISGNNTGARMTSAMFLEYLKVLLSWPVVVGIGGILGAIYYRHEFRELVNRIGSIEALGVKLGTTQADITLKEGATDVEPEPVAVDEPVPAAVADAQVSPEERANLEAAFTAERAAARMWEYRFLNYYFAPSTQAVLDWFVGLAVPTTFNAFEALFINAIVNKPEREAVITALQKHSCILVNAQTLAVTEKGREYAGWNERRVFAVTATLVR